MKVERIMVCGLGKLGAPIAAVFAVSGIPVTGFDVDAGKVRAMNANKSPIRETDLADYLVMPEVRKNLWATDSVKQAVEMSDACLFVAPTPSLGSGAFDHHHLICAVGAVALEVSKQHKRKYLFIVNSTIMPGASRDQLLPLLNRLVGHLGFHLAYKPEFIALGTVIRDLHYPDVLLIGASCEEAGLRTEQLYREMVLGSPKVHRTTLVEAELAKISLNCAVTMKISFANQVGLVAQKLGANPAAVLAVVGDDSRIGSAALRAGLPFGGPCFPRDNRMFARVAELVGESAPIARAVDLINRRTLRVIADEALASHGDIGILGMAYKPGTTILEESPGGLLRHMLVGYGRRVRTHDPVATCTHTFEEVIACPTIVVACAWPEYRELTLPSATRLVDPMSVVTRLEIPRSLEVAS